LLHVERILENRNEDVIAGGYKTPEKENDRKDEESGKLSFRSIFRHQSVIKPLT